MRECKYCKCKKTGVCKECNNQNRYKEARRWDDIAIDEGRIRS